jgi:CheY-like chemotaxis protein
MLSEIQQHNQHSTREANPTLVIVEDDANKREVLRMLLSDATPYRLLMLESGRSALHHVDEIIASDPILFLLDYQLPSMTGLDLYDQLHGLPELEAVPALILTAHATPHIIAAITQHGLPFLLKPFDIDDLFQTIDRFVLRA